jgi:hypothetical protein
MTVPHGTNSRYTNNACRCDDCRWAHSDAVFQQRRARALLVAKDPSLVPHGVASTYNNWMCRCDLCRAANTVRLQKWRVARRRKS